MSDDRSDRDGRSPAENGSDQGEERKVNIVNSYRSQSKERSRSRSPATRKSKKKYYSRSRSRSRSRGRSRRSKRSRSRSSRHYKRYSRSYSRSASYSPPYRRGRGRTHSRSPMSNRRRHNGNRENPEPTRCLGVFGLSTYTSEDQLYYIFNKYGPVDSVQVVIDVKTGYSRGFAFVYFEKTDDAREAKEQCSGMEIDGRKIRVDYSITQRAHTPTPGIYMGKPTYYRRERNDWGGGRDYYGGGGGGSYRSGRYRSPSPYYSSKSSRRRYDRSRSRSYSPYY